jgi:hypothetical protein
MENPENPTTKEHVLTCPPLVERHGRGIIATHGEPMPANVMGQTFNYGAGANARAKMWSNRTKTLADLADLLANHVESSDKDGQAIMCGDLIGKVRSKQAVRAMCMIGFDVDGGTSLEEAKSALATFGYMAILATTHSHGKISTGIPRKAFDAFADKRGLPKGSDIDHLAIARAMLLDKGYKLEVLQPAAYAGLEQTADGWQHFVTHAPVDKFRVFLQLAEPFVFTHHGKTEDEAWKCWETGVLSLARILKLNIDHACLDPSRLWYLPRHRADAPFESHVYRGPLLRFEDITIAASSATEPENDAFGDAGHALAGEDSIGGDESWRFAPSGLDLIGWTSRSGHCFELAEALRSHAPEHVRADNAGKLTATCPFADGHSTSGGMGFFCQDASEVPGEAYRAFCSHAHCKGRKKWEFLAKMLADKWLPEDVIAPGSEFMAALVEDETAKGSCPEAKLEGSRADQKSIAEQARSKRIHDILAVIDGFNADTPDTDIDSLFAELVALNVGKAQGRKIVQKIARKAARKPDEVSERAKRAFVVSKLKSKSTIFDNEEEGVAALNEHVAIVKLGNNVRYLIQDDADDKAIEFFSGAAAADWFEPWKLISETANGDPKLTPLFRQWKESAARRKYTKVVFRPDGVTDPEHFNTWTGLRVAPKAGDWRNLQRHIFTVICGGDPALFEYVIAWCSDVFQRPETKPGVILVLNSAIKGTGKSIFAKALRRILGPHGTTLSSPKALTRDFNSHMERALVVFGEEMLWGGDRSAVGPLKRYATDHTVVIERKYMEPIEVENFTRFMLMSNEERAVPAEGEDERRFCILEAGSQHVGDMSYFSKLATEIDGDGTAAFLHDLMRFDLSRIDVRRAPKTKALAEQIEAGLGNDKKWWMGVLSQGAFIDKDGDVLEEPKDWETGPVTVPRKVVFESFNAVVKEWGAERVTDAQIGRFLTKLVPGLRTPRLRDEHGNRAWSYTFPPLAECIAAFEKTAGVRFDPSTIKRDGVIPVNPIDDLWQEAARQMEIDSTIAMIISPEEPHYLQRDGIAT